MTFTWFNQTKQNFENIKIYKLFYLYSSKQDQNLTNKFKILNDSILEI